MLYRVVHHLIMILLLLVLIGSGLLLPARAVSATNFLQNGSFETFTQYDDTDPYRGAVLKVATGWNRFVESGEVFFMSTREFNDSGWGCHCWVDTYDGNDSQIVFTPNGPFPYVAGVYQQVSGMTPGVAYAFSGRIASAGTGAPVGRKMGIDPYGGSDPKSPNVVWGNETWGNSSSGYENKYVSTLALSSTITVFFHVNHPGGAGNSESFLEASVLDVAPLAHVNPLPAFVGTPDFAVGWSLDMVSPGANLLYYDVQVKDGAGGAWTDWLTKTTNTSATFSGSEGHTYYFQARAWAMHPTLSNVGERLPGLYPGGDGQAHTSLCSVSQQVTLTVGTPSPSADVPQGLAIDPNTNRLYVGNDVDNSIAIFDGNTHALLGTIAGVAKPNGVAVDPALNRVYVTNRDSATVTVIDAQTNGIIGSIPVGSLPYGVAVDPHTHRVYVANWGTSGSSISIINGTTLQVVKTIPVDNYAAQVAVNPATHRAYVTTNTGSKLYVINGNDNVITATGVAPGIVGVTVDVVNNLVYVASRDYSLIYVVDGATNGVTKTITPPSRPYAVAVHPFSNLLYVTAAEANTLYGIDTTSDLLAATLPIGGGAEDGLTINLSANRLYVANNFSGTVSVVQDGCATAPALPTSAVLPLPAIEIATTFPVGWSGIGGVGGIGSWDVQARSMRLADQSTTAWAGWLTNTLTTTAVFTGQDGYAYAFRSRAWDNAGRAEAYPSEPDAATQVLVTPAPVLVNSQKSIRQAVALPGDVLTYTIMLSNTGNLSGTVLVTDTLPVSYTRLLTNTLQASAGTLAYTETILTWNGPVSTGNPITISFAVQISDSLPLGTYITNHAQVNDRVHQPFTRTATTVIPFQVYLPLVLRVY